MYHARYNRPCVVIHFVQQGQTATLYQPSCEAYMADEVHGTARANDRIRALVSFASRAPSWSLESPFPELIPGPIAVGAFLVSYT